MQMKNSENEVPVFGTTTDYALRALLLLARQSTEGGRLRAGTIAAATGAPRNYMGKVLNILAREKLISSSRGPTGGFTLAKAPSQISIGTLVDLFETLATNPRCLNGNAPCSRTKPCAAHRVWVEMREARRAPLDSTTLADLVDPNIAPLVTTRGGTSKATRVPNVPSTRNHAHVNR
jgi:Rrf2 family transcriptional regulator, iron-sulfur cluster assembly transcription factor